MKIGELSRQTGVSIETVRFYERNGVLPEPSRSESGYRKYSELDVRRMKFVRRAKHLGFTLAEIQTLLGLSENRESDMAAFNSRALLKLQDVELRIAELERVRNALQSLIDACPGEGHLEHCPILAALSEDLI